MNYSEAMAFMEEVRGRGIVPGLESIRELCRRLGDPQDFLKFVHVAGTNGKGSTIACLFSVLHRAGYRTGRFTSPAVFEYREMIRVGKRPITKNALCRGLEQIKKVCEEMEKEGFPHPTAFEVETALAFWYFREEGCDIVLLETGMGGLEDATNVVANTLVAVLTSIGMDHMKFLGDTPAKIAACKAGIIKPGCKVVTPVQSEEVLEVIRKTCAEKSCELAVADSANASHVRYGLEKQSFDYGGFRKLEVSLGGRFQVVNGVLAIEVLRALESYGYRIPETALRKGLKDVKWEGRFTVLARRPLFLADGAHNEDAARKLADSIEFYFTNKRIIYIMGMLKDKECEKVIALTAKYADQIITVTPPDNPRALPAYELAAEAARIHPSVTAVDSLEEAVEMSYLLAGKEDVILAFGSLSYLGRLISLVKSK